MNINVIDHTADVKYIKSNEINVVSIFIKTDKNINIY